MSEAKMEEAKMEEAGVSQAGVSQAGVGEAGGSWFRYWDELTTPTAAQVELAACHALVWAYRRELGAVWPTPGRVDALRFAVTEAAEALDAWLRTNPAYARNRAREMDVLDELADCAMMLLTALGPEPGPMGRDLILEWPTLERMVRWCAEALDFEASGQKIRGEWLWDLVAMMAAQEGMGLHRRLQGRLERIKAKRLGVGG